MLLFEIVSWHYLLLGFFIKMLAFQRSPANQVLKFTHADLNWANIFIDGEKSLASLIGNLRAGIPFIGSIVEP